MVITGLDAGIAHGGVATLRVSPSFPPKVLKLNTFKTKSADGDFGDRLKIIYEIWSQHLREFSPEALAAEEQERSLQGHQQRGTTNAKAFGAFAVFNVARGVALHGGLPFIILTPQQAKRAVGCSTRAEKAEVKAGVKRIVEGLPRVYSEHAADAIAVAIGGARRLRTDRQLGRRTA